MVAESQGSQVHQIVKQAGQAVGLDPINRDVLIELVKQSLSEQEKLIVLLSYSEKLNAAEIGQVLDLSEARVTQIKTAVLSRLRTQLAWQGDA